MEALTLPLRAGFVRRVWAVAFAAATVVGGLFVLVDIVSRRSAGEAVPVAWAAAEQLVPLYGWALLAPVLIALLRRSAVTSDRLWWGLLLHFALGPVVAVAKIAASAPLAELFIWNPRGVPFEDGFIWLLTHRVLPNMLVYWLIVAVYHAVARPSPAGVERISRPGERRLPLRAEGRVVLVEPGEIDHIGVDGNYVLVHAGGAVHRVRGTLASLASRLPSERFLRIHRSHLVNMERIREVQPWSHGDYLVILRDGTQLVSGRSHRARVRSLIEKA